MSKRNAALRQPPAPDEDANSYLGRATICALPEDALKGGGQQWRAQLPSGKEVDVALAVPYGYRPQAGDEVVVVGEENRYFVIGVTKHAGKIELRFHGDVDLRSSHGTIELQAAKKVRLIAQEVELRSEVLSVVAEKIIDKAATIYQHARQLLSLRAGEKREVVQGDCNTQAERVHIASKEAVKVNGREIHLG